MNSPSDRKRRKEMWEIKLKQMKRTKEDCYKKTYECPSCSSHFIYILCGDCVCLECFYLNKKGQFKK